MRKVQLERIDLRIHGREDQSLEGRAVSTLDSAAASAPVALPARLSEIEELLHRIDEEIRRDAATTAGRSEPSGSALPQAEARQSAPPLPLKDLGNEFHDTLLQDKVRDLFRDHLDRMGADRGPDRIPGFRMRLIFDSTAPAAAWLPYEILLYGTDSFIGREPWTPISYSLPGRASPPELDVKAPVRVLLVAPNPVDSTPLDLSTERELIEAALRRHRAIDLETLKPPTLQKLNEVLREEGPFHVLHFMGHGSFEENVGSLTFEREDQASHPVSGHVLSTCLKNHRDLRLVVLNSCSSGSIPRQDGQDPFSGVATALLKVGIPAVVAMRVGISDRAAITFSKGFYDALVNEDPVDVAVTQGRLAIYSDNSASLEWITPMTFMQVADGGLKFVGGVPVRAGFRSLAPLDPGMRERTDFHLRFLDKFDGRFLHPEYDWHEDIFCPIRHLLLHEVLPELSTGQQLVLELPAHLSVAYAAGYVLEVKTGPIAIRQRGETGLTYWRDDEGGSGPDWEIFPPEEPQLSLEGPDLALAVSISRDAQPQVVSFLKDSDLPVGQLLVARPRGGPGRSALKGGAHAFALAKALTRYLARWRAENHDEPTIHIFAAPPNAFMFYLGQWSLDLGRVQLYEFPFGTTSSRYFPSLSFPPAPCPEESEE